MRLRARRATAGVTDAVAAEVAEILTQFTPGGEQARVFKVAQRQRPDGALAVAVVRIGVVEVEFVLPAQGAADLREGLQFIRAVRVARFAAGGVKRLRGEAYRPLRRQDVMDFGE